MEIKIQSFRISLVLKSILFPLTSTEVFDSLRSRDFEIGRPPGPIPTGPRVYVGGAIARKQGIMINLDQNRNIVGAQGESIEAALEIFNEILEMLREDFYVNLEEELNYVELIAHCMIKSENNPFLSIQNSVELNHREEIETILDAQVSESRLSIAPLGILPSNPTYFEINLSPKITMPTKAYWCEVLFRNESHEAVVEFASNLTSTISRIINSIEGV